MVDWKRLAVIGAGVAVYPTAKTFMQQITGQVLGGQLMGINIADLAVFGLAGWGTDRLTGDWRDFVGGIAIGAFASLVAPFIGQFMGALPIGAGGGSSTSSTSQHASVNEYVKAKYGM